MSSTRNEVLTCWTLIESVGITRPWVDRAAASQALDAWVLILSDQPPGRLQALTLAWLRSSEVRYGRWPLPGALLHALGDAVEPDDSDALWGLAIELAGFVGSANLPATPEEMGDSIGTQDRKYYALREIAETSLDGTRRAVASAQGARAARLLRLYPAASQVGALYAGLQAVGGWRGIGRVDVTDCAADRASFRAAVRAHNAREASGRVRDEVAALGAPQGAQRLRDGGRESSWSSVDDSLRMALAVERRRDARDGGDR